eukprot:4507545-Lingulodinium_polyedra.AAC.1
MARSSPRPPRGPRGLPCERCPLSGCRPRSSTGCSTPWRVRAAAGPAEWSRPTGGRMGSRAAADNG